MASSEERLVTLDSPVAEAHPLIGEGDEDSRVALFGCCRVPRALFNVIALGSIFMLLFTAFAPSQVRLELTSATLERTRASCLSPSAANFSIAPSALPLSPLPSLELAIDRQQGQQSWCIRTRRAVLYIRRRELYCANHRQIAR